MADQFTVNLEALDSIGMTYLPGLARDLGTYVEHLRAATGAIPPAFDTMQGDAHNLFRQPGDAIEVAMDYMRRVIEDNRQNVELAAAAINEIALRYRRADGQA